MPSLCFALILAGCASPDASATPTDAVATPSPSVCASTAALNLRTPSGDTVNLTGYWVSGATQNTFWRIAQYGTCMAWVGEITTPDQEPADPFPTAFLFFGTIRDDFTIEGQFFLLPHGRPMHREIQSGQVMFRVTFGPDGSPASTQLILERGGQDLGRTGPFGAGNGTIWVRYTRD